MFPPRFFIAAQNFPLFFISHLFLFAPKLFSQIPQVILLDFSWIGFAFAHYPFMLQILMFLNFVLAIESLILFVKGSMII